MRDTWKNLLQILLPDGRDLTANARYRMLLWRGLILAAIALAAGPDIMASLELRILLEILGVALFTTVFVAGAKLLLAEALNSALIVFLPAANQVEPSATASVWERATAIAHILFHSRLWLVVGILLCVCATELIRILL